ncbi:MAG: 1,4-alpha-glucan branching enzyme, partial [Pseudomonadota bacterium]|nr:1,4-alpha-glucan branching enzyme [Pseudomonadota bacterium]
MTAEIAALVEGRHGDPFALLGPHDGVVRTFIPDADGVDVIDRTGSRIASLDRQHPRGFFAGQAALTGPYRLRIQTHGITYEAED